MYRAVCLTTLAAFCCLSLGPVRSERRPPPAAKEGLAFQEALEKAIAEAEPSIACVLVSRSDKYKDFGQGPSPDQPGKLGEFRFNFADREVSTATRQKALKLDLANPNNVPESFGSGVVIGEKPG